MENQYDSMSGSIYGDYQPPAKKKGGVVAAIIAAVVVIAACLAVSIFVLGVFDSAQVKVCKAVVKTMEDRGELGKALNFTSLMESGEFTINVKGNLSYYGTSVNGDIDIVSAKEGKEVYADISAPLGYYGNVDMKVGAQLDKEALRVYCDKLSDVYALYYNEDPDGFLGDVDNMETYEKLADVLKQLASSDYKQAYEDASKDVLEILNELEFEKADKESFEVNGKDRKCSGYTVEVELDELADTILEKYEDILDQDAFWSLKYELEDLKDEDVSFDLTFYLYKGMLAAVTVTVDREDVTLEFRGGDFRTQNMAVVSGKTKLMEVKGSTKGSVEKRTVRVDGEEVASYKYDADKNKLSISANVDGMEAGVDLSIKAKKNEVVIELTDITYMGTSISSMIDDYSLEVTISKGGDLRSFKGTEVNLGDLSQEELMNVAYEIEEAFDF